MNLTIYTNILTPYRTFFFDLLNKLMKANGHKFHVIVMAEGESNRSWQYENLKREYTILMEGMTFHLSNARIHINYHLFLTLKKLKPSILVCAGSYLCPGVIQAARWKNKLGYKCLFWSESHLYENTGRSKTVQLVREYFRHKIYNNFDGFWYAGKLSLEFVNKYANPCSQKIFVPNLVDENKFQSANELRISKKYKLRNKYNLHEKKIILFSPIRLEKEKGMLEFFEVWKLCKNKCNCQIAIAGEGELASSIRHKADDYGIDVVLLGYCQQCEVIELYAASDVFLLPSLSDPNPLSVIEALWADLPLIVTNHVGNHPETIEEYKNGIVINYSNLSQNAVLVDTFINKVKNGNYTRSQEIAKNNFSSVDNVNRLIKELSRL